MQCFGYTKLATVEIEKEQQEQEQMARGKQIVDFFVVLCNTSTWAKYDILL